MHSVAKVSAIKHKEITCQDVYVKIDKELKLIKFFVPISSYKLLIAKDLYCFIRLDSLRANEFLVYEVTSFVQKKTLDGKEKKVITVDLQEENWRGLNNVVAGQYRAPSPESGTVISIFQIQSFIGST